MRTVQGSLSIELGWILVVLYDDVLSVVWIGDETLTWVHKHNVTSWRRQRKWIGFATGRRRAFIAPEGRGSDKEFLINCGRALKVWNPNFGSKFQGSEESGNVGRLIEDYKRAGSITGSGEWNE